MKFNFFIEYIMNSEPPSKKVMRKGTRISFNAPDNVHWEKSTYMELLLAAFLVPQSTSKSITGSRALVFPNPRHFIPQKARGCDPEQFVFGALIVLLVSITSAEGTPPPITPT